MTRNCQNVTVNDFFQPPSPSPSRQIGGNRPIGSSVATVNANANSWDPGMWDDDVIDRLCWHNVMVMQRRSAGMVTGNRECWRVSWLWSGQMQSRTRTRSRSRSTMQCKRKNTRLRRTACRYFTMRRARLTSLQLQLLVGLGGSTAIWKGSPPDPPKWH